MENSLHRCPVSLMQWPPALSWVTRSFQHVPIFHNNVHLPFFFGKCLSFQLCDYWPSSARLPLPPLSHDLISCSIFRPASPTVSDITSPAFSLLSPHSQLMPFRTLSLSLPHCRSITSHASLLPCLSGFLGSPGPWLCSATLLFRASIFLIRVLVAQTCCFHCLLWALASLQIATLCSSQIHTVLSSFRYSLVIRTVSLQTLPPRRDASASSLLVSTLPLQPLPFPQVIMCSLNFYFSDGHPVYRAHWPLPTLSQCVPLIYSPQAHYWSSLTATDWLTFYDACCGAPSLQDSLVVASIDLTFPAACVAVSRFCGQLLCRLSSMVSSGLASLLIAESWGRGLLLLSIPSLADTRPLFSRG